MEKRTIGIVGAGMIGSSLAVLAAGNGFPAVVLVRSAASEVRCRAKVDAYYADLAANGLVSEAQAAICKRYIRYTTRYEELAGCAVIFETVRESFEDKAEVYRQLAACCPDVEAVATTTSVLSVEELAPLAGLLADRFLAAHPFNPPHVVLYVELVPAASTRPEAMDRVQGMLEAMGRVCIRLKKNAPGFIANRLQYALFREAIHLVEMGVADPRDIDRAMQLSFIPRYSAIGLFEHIDLVGMDLRMTTCEYLYPQLCDDKHTPALVKEHVARGELGCKTHKGVYDWDDEAIADLRRRSAAPFLQQFNWHLPEA